MRKGLSIWMLLLQLPLLSNHIVGGEIEFITISPGLYRINVIQYFDEAQEINPGPEASVIVYIFSNATNTVVSSHILNLDIQTEVHYTNQECAIDELQTSRVIWTADIELDPEDYAEPEGYYIVWERCCRNLLVRNIVNAIGTGMKYVTEIPPLWKDDEPYINSSPILFQPLSDYACISQLYYVSFTGSDPDGDSLVYSMATPLNSSAAVAVPIAQPKPHIPVQFAQGYSVHEQIIGTPSLDISDRGLLTVTPEETGLYVFSVLVEEFRHGKKIGQVQRDFQMLVVDGCNPPDPPEVAVQIPGNDDFQTELDTLKYALTDDKCFEFIVSNITPGETISLRAEGVNFEGDIDEIFEFNQRLVFDSVLTVEICAPGCPPFHDRPFIVDLIAADDACPLPQMDTLRLIMDVEPPPNEFPDVTPSDFTEFVDEDNIFRQVVTARDADGDLMTIAHWLPTLDAGDYGFEVNVTESEPGLLVADVIWDTDCEAYDFGNLQNFPLTVLVDDMDSCDFKPTDDLLMSLGVRLPPNTDPVVSVDDYAVDEITVAPNEIISFDVSVVDDDGDTVNLGMIGEGFNPDAFGASFEEVWGEGNASSEFSWFTDCNFLNPESENSFTFLFVADDVDKCQVPNFDTLAFTINIDLPENFQPEIETELDFRLEINEPFSTDILAFDDNPGDLITLQFWDRFRLPRSPSLRFDPVAGRQEVSSTLYWTPECDLLGREKSRFYDLYFMALDDNCPQPKLDTVKVTFEIVETRDRFNSFLPPNAFSPNDDGFNEVFSLTNLLDPNANLPVDNCDDAFEYISIHNRAGETIFYSEKRDFNWDGGEVPSGVYFYVIKYTKTEYKNYLQLLR